MLKKAVLLLITITFLLVSSLGFAAEKKYYVTKDKNGVCKVIQAKDKTPTTIAGPFDSKADADKEKAVKCPKKKK
ncbi:MAG: hypothetical protein HY912_06570 [Desulfomonile tiedjei]|uniref:Uncharacterized protein n=1 Tax=Desulfomonile tiedjei TaxID=2358 RepID=A0A9D6UZ85_9BACT|nr:hypothetical protein [Desulfomonile tiedjei]